GLAVRRALAHAPARRPVARGRRRRDRVLLEARARARLLGRRAAVARALHAGRRESRGDPAAPGRVAVSALNILFVGDVFATAGRKAVEERLPGLREELDVDFCIVNGENAADGAGITPRLADRLLAAGADAITLGNHVWRRPEIGPYLAESDRVIRPANVASGSPGRGLTVLPSADGTPVAVVNLLGQLFVNTPVSPFEVVDELVDEARRGAQVVLLDFHAEATSEKV